jgi:hypothetical protein
MQDASGSRPDMRARSGLLKSYRSFSSYDARAQANKRSPLPQCLEPIA